MIAIQPTYASVPCRHKPKSNNADGWVLLWRVVGWANNFSTRKNKTPSAFANGVSEFNLDDDLLSHGETPHYHRRCIVSLLSSGWDQVVPMLYGRQEIRLPVRGSCEFTGQPMGM